MIRKDFALPIVCLFLCGLTASPAAIAQQCVEDKKVCNGSYTIDKSNPDVHMNAAVIVSGNNSNRKFTFKSPKQEQLVCEPDIVTVIGDGDALRCIPKHPIRDSMKIEIVTIGALSGVYCKSLKEHPDGDIRDSVSKSCDSANGKCVCFRVETYCEQEGEDYFRRCDHVPGPDSPPGRGSGSGGSP